MRTLTLTLSTLILAFTAGCPADPADDDTSGDDDGADDDTGGGGCEFQAPTEWAAAGTLPSQRESMAVAAYAGAVIVLGGWNGAAATDEVVIGDLVDGQIDSWQSATPLPVGLEHHAAVVHDGALYVLGGDDGVAGRDEVYWAELGGGLGSWHETTPLPASRVFHAAVAYGDWIYVIGGTQGFSTAQSTVYRGTLSGDHEISGWEEARALPDSRYAAGAVVHDDHLYVLGGAWTGSSATASGWAAAIAPDGTLGEWGAAMGLPAALLSHGVVLAGDRVLLSGGLEAWQTPSAEVSAALASTGPTTWAPAAALPAPRFAHGAVLVGDHVLLFGGWEDFTVGIHDSVLSAQVCE